MSNLMTQNQLSKELGITRKTLYIWRSQGLPSIWANNGVNMYMYDLNVVRRWMKQQNKKIKK